MTGSLEDPRKNRIDRLEQIRRGTGIGTDNSSVADSVGGGSEYNRGEGEEGVKYHDSAESSVEGEFEMSNKDSSINLDQDVSEVLKILERKSQCLSVKISP